MKIMFEASTYNRYRDIVISIDGQGSILNVQISKKDDRGNIYFGDGLTVDTDLIGKDY